MERPGAPQPPRNAAYQTEGNPATSSQHEERAARRRGGGHIVAERDPGDEASDVRDAVPSSLGWGTRGAPSGEERFGRSEEEVGRHRELEGDQMRAAGEGRVADAVGRKPGATGSQPDLASDLDRKKREQAGARQAIKEGRRHGQISDGGVGGVVNTELDRTL